MTCNHCQEQLLHHLYDVLDPRAARRNGEGACALSLPKRRKCGARHKAVHEVGAEVFRERRSVIFGDRLVQPRRGQYCVTCEPSSGAEYRSGQQSGALGSDRYAKQGAPGETRGPVHRVVGGTSAVVGKFALRESFIQPLAELSRCRCVRPRF